MVREVLAGGNGIYSMIKTVRIARCPAPARSIYISRTIGWERRRCSGTTGRWSKRLQIPPDVNGAFANVLAGNIYFLIFYSS
jgi:hypothetical protein